MDAPRLADLPPARRLAVGLFLVCLLAFYGLAQVKVFTAVGGGGFPGPAAVLAKYHGTRAHSRLHAVLDPRLSTSDPKRMYDHLGATDEDRAANRVRVLAWVEAGASAAGWPALEPVFAGDATCGGCHSTKDETRTKRDLPFERYEQVAPFAGPDEGMGWAELSTSSHNHMFGFAVVALLASVIFTATRWRGPLVPLLVASAFLGALLDVGAWWLTKALGSPFHLLVIAGGAAFGGSVLAMVVLSLDELWLRGSVARLVSPLLTALRLGRREA